MKRSRIGFILLGSAFTALLAKYYFITGKSYNNLIYFISILDVVTGILVVFPFEQIIFDNKEWERSKTLPGLIFKIRLRAVLFNNLSVIIFLIAVLVILAGFYILIYPQENIDGKGNQTDLTMIRISATALLIFLVQILFRAFKYVLRVAAFYNGKADAMEASAVINNSDLAKLMDLFTPSGYDISDAPYQVCLTR